MTEMKGQVYSKMIAKEDIGRYRCGYQVLSTQLKAGELHIRVLSDKLPPDGFSPAEPNLEDVYFSHIATRMDVNTL
jgi:hypothetical protein